MTTDDQLRQALAAIADFAPDAEPVRDRMAARVRAFRQRRALLVTGAVVAGTAAVGVPAAFWLDRRSGGQSNLPMPAIEPTHPGNPRASMRLRPSWLPEGVLEFERSATVGGVKQQRVWASQAAIDLMKQGKFEQALGQAMVLLTITRPEPIPYVTPSVIDPVSPPPGPQPFLPLGGPATTTLGGRQARLDLEPNGQSTMAWFIDDAGTVAAVSVTSIPDSGKLAQRIAESTVADTASVCEVSLSLGWLPPQVSGHPPEISVTGLPPAADWHEEVVVAGPQIDIGVSAMLYPGRDLRSDASVTLNDQDVTMRGRPAKLGRHEGYASAEVELEGPRLLRVLCYVGTDDDERAASVQRITHDLTIGPDPYLGWIGTR